MSRFHILALGLVVLSLCSVCLADSNVQGIAVAEQTAQGSRLKHPTPEHPANYVAYDAGYIEAGYSVVGLKPPSATAVARSLRAALASAGYEAASAQTPPSLLLIYHWGSIRPESQNELIITSNLEARLFLVAPARMVRQAEEFLTDGKMAKAAYVASDERDTLDFADGGHYFVVVSAYDFADLTRQTATLLWRLKLSTQENSGSMDQVLPALIGNCGRYLGCSFDNRQNISALLQPRSTGEIAGEEPHSDSAQRINAGVIQSLMKQERDFLSGTPDSSNRNSPRNLPPELAQRIAAYRQEKAAIQSILAEKIRNQAPGPDTRHAIDTFNAENSVRIAALGRMGESIRSELARLRTANSPPTDGQPLDALLREFVVDARLLKNPPAK